MVGNDCESYEKDRKIFGKLIDKETHRRTQTYNKNNGVITKGVEVCAFSFK